MNPGLSVPGTVFFILCQKFPSNTTNFSPVFFQKNHVATAALLILSAAQTLAHVASGVPCPCTFIHPHVPNKHFWSIYYVSATCFTWLMRRQGGLGHSPFQSWTESPSQKNIWEARDHASSLCPVSLHRHVRHVNKNPHFTGSLVWT